MSTDQRAESPRLTAMRPIPEQPGERPTRPANPVPSWLRFFGSELRLVFRRPRNLALLGVLAVVPIFFGVVLRLTLHNPAGAGNGPEFVNQLAGNGVFLALVVLFLTETLLLLPL